MNIDNLTLGEIKQINGLFNGNAVASNPKCTAKTENHPMLGRYVICRFESAGVHAGVLASKNGNEVTLTESRRLWSWAANAGVALSGLAVNGLKSGKVDTLMGEICVLGVIEILPCSAKAEETIRAA